MRWTRLIEGLALPPVGLIWLGLAGLVLLTRGRKRSATTCLALSLLGLLLLSMPFVGNVLLNSVDRYPPLASDGPLPDAEVIVILGGGTRDGAREYGGDTVSPMALERLRYGAWLARRTGRPILVTGWSYSEMAETLETAFGVRSQWQVGGATTYGNAVFSAEALHPENIRRVYLVTHFWHMPRSMAAFRAEGFEPVAAPHGFSESFRLGAVSLFPSVSSLAISRQVMHEWVGRVWYRLRWGA